MKLTKTQQAQLNELKNGPLYVGYNCPGLIRLFDKLVTLGLAEVVKQTDLGKKYRAI